MRKPYWLLVSMLLTVLLACPVFGQQWIVDGSFSLYESDPAMATWICRSKELCFAPNRGRQGAGSIGTGAGRLLSEQDFQDELLQPLLSLTPGKEYILSAYARVASGSGQASIGIRQESSYPRIYRSLTSEWERIEMAFIPSAGWAQAVLSVSAGCEVLWDDITLQESHAISAKLAGEWEDKLAAGELIYTGLVVDARGTGLERGMSPKILDEYGNLLFAGVGASGTQLIKDGLVAYVRSVDDAAKHSRMRVCEEYPLQLPLVISAQKAVGYPQAYFPATAVVVGQADASLIRESIQTYDFLGRFAIVFVVD